MKPVITETIHYVDTCSIIKFIMQNSPKAENEIIHCESNSERWNNFCQYVRTSGIVGEETFCFYEKKHLFDNPSQYNEAQVKWIGEFFKAHPFIEKMMICYNP